VLWFDVSKSKLDVANLLIWKGSLEMLGGLDLVSNASTKRFGYHE
jgi:hypothetical protein